MAPVSSFVTSQISWIMLISGLSTVTMFYAFVAPQAALQSMFGDQLDGPLAEVVVRNWAALITLIGVMLIWGSFHTDGRFIVVLVAALSKLTFVALVLINMARPLKQQLLVAIVADIFFVLLFAVYLLS